MDKGMKLEKTKWTKGMSPKAKLFYFWDYYKWHTIIGLILCIGLSFLIYDLATNRTPDFSLIYAGSAPFSEGTRGEGEASLKGMTTDVNGDGSVYPVFLTYQFSADDSMSQMDMANQMSLMTNLAAGESYAMIFDDEFYQRFLQEDAYVDLNVLFGLSLKEPTSIPLGDTALGSLPGFSDLPKDSHVVVFSRFQTLKDSKKEKDRILYEKTLEIMKSLFA